jgi:preprotein translocase subunit SecG
MDQLHTFIREFFNFLERATFGKFFTFLIFLLVLFYLWKH